MYNINVRIFNTVLHIISERRDWRARVLGRGRNRATENRLGRVDFEYFDGGACSTSSSTIPTPTIYHSGGQKTRFIPTRGGERSTIAIPRLN